MKIVLMGKMPLAGGNGHPEFKCPRCGTVFQAESRFEYEVDYDTRCHHTIRRTRSICPICGERDVSNGWQPWD